MRNGQLSSEEKARAVLCRTGRPGNECACLEESEIEALAAIYEECLAPELLLKERLDAFWGDRRKRLEAAKATDAATDRDLFRNRVAAASPLDAATAAPASGAIAGDAGDA